MFSISLLIQHIKYEIIIHINFYILSLLTQIRLFTGSSIIPFKLEVTISNFAEGFYNVIGSKSFSDTFQILVPK